MNGQHIIISEDFGYISEETVKVEEIVLSICELGADCDCPGCQPMKWPLAVRNNWEILS